VESSSLQLAVVGVVFLLVLFTGAWIDKKWRAYKTAKAASKAAKNGLRAEKEAEKLLKKLGYVLLQRQPPASYWAVVDDEPQNIKLSGDLLVELKGKTYLAEVKTGKAVKLDHAETRRQLLEYQLAFGVDGLLLVDMEALKVRSIRFPAPKPAAKAVAATAKKKKAARLVTIAAAAGAVVWLVSRSMVEPAVSPEEPDVVEHAPVVDDGEGVQKPLRPKAAKSSRVAAKRERTH
jgi:CheY-like chemotaxis protein